MWNILCLLLLTSPLLAREGLPKYLNQFGGLDVYHDSSKISDADSSDTRNCLTDRGFLEMRTGNTRLQTLLAGYATLFLKEFIAPSRTRYLIGHASSTLYQTDLSVAPASISTANVSYPMDAVSAFGRYYFVDGLRTLSWWNGTSSGTIGAAPIGTFIEFDDERIYLANTDTSDCIVHASSYGAASYWTVPSVVADFTPDSPNWWYFGQTDGEPITCFMKTPWGKFIGKRHSCYILKGYNNDTYYKRLLDPNIGCVDDRTVQMVDGTLMWLALDGVYGWKGREEPKLLSQDIEPLIKQIRQLNSNKASWIVNLMVDWQAGKLDVSGPGALVSATISPGSITPSSWTATDTSAADFAAGTLTNTSTTSIPTSLTLIQGNEAAFRNAGAEYSADQNWPTHGADRSSSANQYGSYGWSFGHGIQVESDGVLVKILDSDDNVLHSETKNFSTTGVQYTINTSAFQKQMIKVHIVYNSTPDPPAGYELKSIAFIRGTKFTYWIKEVTAGAGVCDPGYSCTGYVDIPEHLMITTGTIISQNFDTSLSTPTDAPFEVTMSSSSNGTLSFQMQCSSNGVDWTGLTTATPGVKSPCSGYQHRRYKGVFAVTKTTNTPAQIDDVTLTARTTCEYYSDVHYKTTVSNNLTFNAIEAPNGGSLTYWTRTSSNSFTKGSSTPSWVSQTNHINIAASTSTPLYYQWRNKFNVPSGSNAVTLDRVQSNWQQGTELPLASFFHNHRYGLSVMLSSTAVRNDAVLVYQRNKKWTVFDGPSYSAFTIFNNEPIAGDGGTGGYIWKILQDDLYNDDGTAINAYWNTPDFTMDMPGQQKDLTKVWIDAGYKADSRLYVGWSVNKDTIFTSTSTALDSSANYINKRVEGLLDGYASGRYLKLQYGNGSVLDNYFKLNSSTIYYDYQPIRSN